MRRDATKKEEKGSKYLLLFFRVSYRGVSTIVSTILRITALFTFTESFNASTLLVPTKIRWFVF